MKKFKLAGVLLLTVFLMAGCGRGDDSSTSVQNEEDNTENVTQSTDSSENTQNNQQPQDDQETSGQEENQDTDAGDISDENTGGQDGEQREVSIYYIDEATAEPTSETIMITDENDIWAALQDKGVLTDDCELLGFDVNEEENTISINFNSALGDRIRSFGTTGETEILGCLVNTYLDAYNCDGIKLLEEGKTFETSSGANFDGFTGRIEF